MANNTESQRLRRRSWPERSSSITQVNSSYRPPLQVKNQLSLRLFVTSSAIILSAVVAGICYWQLFSYIQHVPFEPIPTQDFDPPTFVHSGLDHVLEPQQHANRPPARLCYNWRITKGVRNPDGVQKLVYLVNDEFPGPTIEARSGDWLEIEVQNSLDDEGLSIHWHGLHMRGFNAMDGAEGFTQGPIPPGSNFTYRFQVSEFQHGSFWYHAHNQVQRADGLFGGLVIHEPIKPRHNWQTGNLGAYDEERLLLVGDWYHRSGTDVLAWYMRAGSFGMEPVPDSLLVNGVGAFNCSNAVRARPLICSYKDGDDIPSGSFNATKTYRLRIVNTGTLAGMTLEIPNSNLTVLTVDGGNPVTVASSSQAIGILHPGQRVDVAMTLTTASTLAVGIDDESFKYENPALSRTHYFPIHVSSSVLGTQNENSSSLDYVDLQSVKSPEGVTAGMPLTANCTMVIYTNTLKLSHLSNIPHGFMNRTSWKPQASPPGPLITLPRSRWDPNQFVPQISTNYSSPTESIWVDLVINNLDDGGHPFHLHGYDVWALQTYESSYGWGSYNPFEMVEPPGGQVYVRDSVKRDTWYIPRRGYVIVRFKADNIGIWMLHCHILWHQASGMAMGLDIV